VICVIADDFTGAAEIGGVALRYGLTVEVQSRFNAETDVDVICLDADTRSCTAESASRRAAWAAQQCLAAGAEVIFKKVDSVLRGQVAAELAGMMAATGLERALLAPANPSLGRTIWDGSYWVQGTPLNETDFAHDAEYPAHTAEVATLIANPLSPAIHVLQPNAEMPSHGIIVAQARTHADVETWASRLESSILPAGAAEFFAAFLERMGYDRVTTAVDAESCMAYSSALFVVGSKSDVSRAFCRECETHDVPVIRIPSGLFDMKVKAEPWISQWVTSVSEAFRTASCVVVAIDRPLQRAPGLPRRLSDCLTTVAQRVVVRHPLDAVFVEGGATAIRLINRFRWEQLRVQRELAPGAVCLRPTADAGPQLAMKPGSYAWPTEVLPWAHVAKKG